MEEEFVIKRECFLKQFEDCRCALSAMGDNTRQLIIRALMVQKNYFLDAKSSSIRLVADFWQTAQEMMALCPRVKEELHHEII